jgi:hypothetical protein
MGEATFAPELGFRPVHPVTVEELKSTAKNLRGTDGEEFSALLALKGALEAKDELLLGRARERLRQVYRQQRKGRKSTSPEERDARRKSGEKLQINGLTREGSLLHIEGLHPGPEAMRNPHRLLSWAVSNTVGMWPQIVLWSVQGELVPAIHCIGLNHDHAMKVALYVHTFFLAPSGALGFRVCPFDGEQFFQKQPNQEYCKPAHREAHRVIRWRKRQKELAREEEEGKHNGTPKTR